MSDNSTEESAMDEPCATSSPKKHKKQKTSHRILPEEYSVMVDDTNEWNPDEAFIDSTQLNESEVTFATSSFSTPSSASSSLSSGSLSNMLEMARQMIANYPNEEQIAEMVAENYINYIRDLTQDVPTEEVVSPVLAPAAYPTTRLFDDEEADEEQDDVNEAHHQ